MNFKYLAETATQTLRGASGAVSAFLDDLAGDAPAAASDATVLPSATPVTPPSQIVISNAWVDFIASCATHPSIFVLFPIGMCRLVLVSLSYSNHVSILGFALESEIELTERKEQHARFE